MYMYIYLFMFANWLKFVEGTHGYPGIGYNKFYFFKNIFWFKIRFLTKFLGQRWALQLVNPIIGE